MKAAVEAPQIAPKLRPMRVVATRQREILCQILRDSEVEWINGFEGLEIPYEIPKQTGNLIIEITDCMASPWHEI